MVWCPRYGATREKLSPVCLFSGAIGLPPIGRMAAASAALSRQTRRPIRHSGHVQDRYAGDLGDYLKFGLLRWLVPPGSSVSPQLGVVWYRTADEAHNGDGKHVAFSTLAIGPRPVCGSLTLTSTSGSLASSPPGSEARPRWPTPECSTPGHASSVT